MSSIDWDSFIKLLRNARQQLRKYSLGGGDDTLWKALGLEKAPTFPYLRAIMVGFISEYATSSLLCPADRDLLLLAYGLLDGYDGFALGKRRMIYWKNCPELQGSYREYKEKKSTRSEGCLDKEQAGRREIRKMEDKLICGLAKYMLAEDLRAKAKSYALRLDSEGGLNDNGYNLPLPTPKYLPQIEKSLTASALTTSERDSPLAKDHSSHIHTDTQCVNDLGKAGDIPDFSGQDDIGFRSKVEELLVATGDVKQTVIESAEMIMREIKADSSGVGYENIQSDNYAPAYNFEDLIDRKDLLVDLNVKLASAVMPVYLHSIGGLGKTEVAKAYCASQYSEQFSYMFWVTATSADVRDDIMNEPSFCFQQNIESTNISSEFRRFATQMTSLQGDILLVIDNINMAEQIQSVERDDSVALLKWKILITTRATIDDVLLKNRIIKLDPLAYEYCEKLFFKHYDVSDRISSIEKETLREQLLKLFEKLKRHTFLIMVFAKVGATKGYSIADLNTFVDDYGIAHENLQIKVSVKVKNQLSRDTIIGLVALLFDFAQLSETEQYVLYCFSVLPDRFFPEHLLAKWLRSDSLSEHSLGNLFRDLHENGWLIIGNSTPDGSVAFTCHELVKSAMREKMKNCLELLDPFIVNVERFFHVKILDDSIALLKYADCIDCILKYYTLATDVSFNLRKDYIVLSRRYGYQRKSIYDHSIWLVENYEKIYEHENNEIQWFAGWINTRLLHSSTFIECTDKENKYIIEEKNRQEIFYLAKKHLPDIHIEYIRAERYLAMSKRTVNRVSESVSDLVNIISKLETIIPDIGQASDDWKYVYMMSLASLGIGYDQLTIISRQKKDFLCERKYLQLSLDTAHKYLNAAISCLGESNTFLRRPYNDICKTYLFLFDADLDYKHLDSARYYLMKQHELLNGRFDSSSEATASALDGTAMLLEREGDLEESLKIAHAILINRQGRHENDNYLVTMKSYKQIAQLNYKIFLKIQEEKYLSDAKENIEKAIGIGGHLYGDTENFFLEECYALRNEIFSI